MNRKLKLIPSLALVLLIGWLLSDRIKGIAYKTFLPVDEILIRQLNGDGCGFNVMCEFEVNGFSG